MLIQALKCLVMESAKQIYVFISFIITMLKKEGFVAMMFFEMIDKGYL